MYSHCLFCKSSLGANDAIERFPVGRRLAFDASKGRLWVVCPKCARWNLTPVEERWEAIEDAERLFGGVRLRVQTDNIGMAKLREGTELVRIGPALRPELAAWRYGREFSARFRRRAALVGGGAVALGGGAALVGAPLVAAVAPVAPVLFFGLHIMVPLLLTRGRLIPTKVKGQDGKVLRVFRADLDLTELAPTPDDPWHLLLRHSYGRQELHGETARRALGALLSSTNRGGAASGTVDRSTQLLAEAGSTERVATIVAEEAKRRAGNFTELHKRAQRGQSMREAMADLKQPVKLGEWPPSNQNPWNRGALHRLPRHLRLALEMALHEETERRALEGELAILEAAWREAEEIAAIADNLFAPPLPERP